MSGRRTRVEKPRGLLYYIGVGLSFGLLALVIAVGVFVIVIPAVAGATPLTVLTNSMAPTYPPGTLIIIRPIDESDIEIGDAITYQIESGKPDLVTHRVISVIASSNDTVRFITQGDNNDVADPNPVLPDQIHGKVWYGVPWIGYLNNLMNGSDRVWIVPVLATGLFLYVGYLIASSISGAAKKRRRERERDERDERSSVQ